MSVHERAGQPARAQDLSNPAALVADYYTVQPDLSVPAQRISFGTSGHRGRADRGSFNHAHIVAVTRAVVEYRASAGITGPLFVGADTHALSLPALRSTLQVLAAAGVHAVIQQDLEPVPTPVISRAILAHGREGGSQADGIIITPSHNPPEDGGFKYNPPSGGPAGVDATSVIQARANELLAAGTHDLPSWADALRAAEARDLTGQYVDALGSVLDMDAIRASGLKLGADPLGGASISCWQRIADRYGLDLEVVNQTVDPAFAFMPLDHDGRIRMDCSSPYAMAGLLQLKDRYDVSFASDPDADRHGIVTRDGLMNPNHFLAVAVDYLFRHRPGWPAHAGVGKTAVSSSMIDRVAAAAGRRLVETPVGFKWFVDGLLDGSLGFGGEESAGASFLARDGSAWSTDKDGIIMGLLAAEIQAVTGQDAAERYRQLEQEHGSPVYARIDAAATREQKARLLQLSPADVSATSLAGDLITDRQVNAAGNGEPLGGLKVTTDNGWFAARPSGTEDIYKIYAESFVGRQHLDEVLAEAQAIVSASL